MQEVKAVNGVKVEKVLSYRQRLALQVGRAAKSPEGDNMDSRGASFPYGFAAYAKVAAKCTGKKLIRDWR